MNNENQGRQEMAAGLETAPRKAGSKKWMISSIVAAVVLVSAIVVYGFMSSKTPKEAYLQAEYNSFVQAQETFETNYGDLIELQEKMEKEAYTSELDISGNFDVQLETPDPTLMMVQGLLEQINISVDTQSDVKNEQNYVKLGVELQGTTVADAEVIQSGDQLGVRVPLAYSDFLYLDTTQFGEFMRSVDPYYVGPETLNLDTIKLSDLKLSEDEKAALKETYGKLLIDQLAEENFTREDGVSADINGVSVKADKIELTLSESEVKSLLKAFLTTAAEDKKLQDIIAKRYELIVETAQLEADPTITVLSPEDLKAELVAGLEEAANNVDQLVLESGIKSTIWVNSDEQIVQREIMFEAVGVEPVEVVISTYNLENDGKQMKEFKLNVSGSEDTNATLTVSSETEGEGADRKTSTDITAYFKEFGEEVLNVVFTIDSTYSAGEGNEVKSVHDFNLDLGEALLAQSGGFYLNGTVEDTTDINLDEDYANQTSNFTINVGDDYQGGTIELKLDSKTEFKAIDIPSLEGGVNVTELSEQELMSLAEEIMYNLENAVYGLMGQFGAF
ncbi:hypothetical protein SAMN05877753_101294 [Bacillus oleivorans]|uniref:Uncharacterized protein n=1 Tax=Bacillus oleivorans TaxID=1448271 RepID=A0A285CHJ1_9BACI|nr:DUF6583 family protein [Bacillus oleivorans]SNX66980.1 hypothetical protein SAMN05877753_101294 [Bacillus oleivorans]